MNIFETNIVVGGISFTSVIGGLRFLGGIVASLGIMFFIWGFVMYILAHGNEHEKEEGRLYMSQGFLLLFYFTIAWGVVKAIGYFIT